MKKSLKKVSLVALTALSVASVALPSFSAYAQAEQVLNVLVTAEPPTLDPGKASDSTSGVVIRNVFEGLTRKNDKDEVVPGVAESWEVSEDGLTYTFKLRSDAKWSNGEAVKAGDFEYAWKRVLNPETASDYATLLYLIEGAEEYNAGEGEADAVGVKALDDTTLEVTLKNPTAFFLELTSFYTFMPVFQGTIDENADQWALEAGDAYVTNGPFSLSEWNHNSDVVLTKSDSYWDKDNVTLETVNVQIVESEATATQLFQSGDIDYLGSPLGSVSLDSIDTFKADNTLSISPQSSVYWYKVNTTDPVLSNVNIRKALALSINRQALIDNVTKGEQKPALGYVPSSIAGFEEDRGYFADADYEKAKEYLAKGMEELGLKDPSEVSFTLSINTSEAHAAIAQFVQAEWSTNLGVNAEITNSEWQVYLEDIKSMNYQVARLGWNADYNDASTFLDMYKTAADANNATGWESEEYAELLTKAAAETDAAARTQLLKDAEAVMIEDMPVIPIYFYTNLSVKADKVQGLQVGPLGEIDLKGVSISE